AIDRASDLSRAFCRPAAGPLEPGARSMSMPVWSSFFALSGLILLSLLSSGLTPGQAPPNPSPFDLMLTEGIDHGPGLYRIDVEAPEATWITLHVRVFLDPEFRELDEGLFDGLL